MTKLTTFISFLIVLSIGCTTTKRKSSKENIEFSDVKSITIGNGKEDSTALTMVEIDAKAFVRKWNNAYSKGRCKYMSTHWITVNLKDGTKRFFRQNGETMKEKGDECFDMGSTQEYKGLYR